LFYLVQHIKMAVEVPDESATEIDAILANGGGNGSGGLNGGRGFRLYLDEHTAVC